MRETLQKIKDNALLILGIIAGALFFLFRRSQQNLAEEKAKQVAAEERGRLDVLKEETKQAEDGATDSRDDYERLASKHRES
jgi:type II secretory pathway pseudopilin PulG